VNYFNSFFWVKTKDLAGNDDAYRELVIFLRGHYCLFAEPLRFKTSSCVAFEVRGAGVRIAILGRRLSNLESSSASDGRRIEKRGSPIAVEFSRTSNHRRLPSVVGQKDSVDVDT
jgi:hypothetical protein